MLLGIVLAGGQSSRMGRDKALLQWRGETMMANARRSLLDAGCDKVVTSRNAEGFIQDIYPGQGPLSGIHACLSKHQCSEALILPVDMPMMSSGSLRQLIQFGRYRYTSTYFSHSVLPCYLPQPELTLRLCELRLNQSKRSINGLLTALSAVAYCADEAEIPSNQLINTNTPMQWQAAQSMALDYTLC